MEMTLPDIALHKGEYDPETVLEPWAWRPQDGDTVLLPTALGHLFRERKDGTVWFLDTRSGQMEHACDSYDEFLGYVDQGEAFVERWFMAELVSAFLEAGLKRKRGEFLQPVRLTGYRRKSHAG